MLNSLTLKTALTSTQMGIQQCHSSCIEDGIRFVRTEVELHANTILRK